jgi:hypothetical protein
VAVQLWSAKAYFQAYSVSLDYGYEPRIEDPVRNTTL